MKDVLATEDVHSKIGFKDEFIRSFPLLSTHRVGGDKFFHNDFFPDIETQEPADTQQNKLSWK